MKPAPADALPGTAEKSRVVEEMFDRIAPRYDVLNRVLAFRMDVRWRRITVESLGLPADARVLDVACGTGDLCRTLADHRLAPIGVDFSAGMLGAARTDAPLVRADALRLPFADGTFAGLTCGFALRNFAELAPALAECARVVRPGGRIALLEVAQPTGAAARAVHGLWFRRVVPFVGGLVSDRFAYRYLPASTAYLPPLPELLRMVGRAGLVDVTWRELSFGAAQLVTGTRA